MGVGAGAGVGVPFVPGWAGLAGLAGAFFPAAGVTRRTLGTAPVTTEDPGATCTPAPPAGVSLDRRSFAAACAPGAFCAPCALGLVPRPMIAGTLRFSDGATLVGAPAVRPLPPSKARSQIWNDATVPATTTALQTIHENRLRIAHIIAF